MKRILTLILIAILLCTVSGVALDTDVPDFTIKSQSISHGQTNVAITPRILFDFNLRIDPYGISATLNGKAVDILLHEGKKLEIVLSEPLAYETEYKLEVFGVREIYSGQQSPLGEITFKTISHVQLISQEISDSTRSFHAKVKNYSADPKEVVFIVTAKDLESNMVLDVKILKKSVESGKTADFSHFFSNLNENCKIFALGFSDFGTLTQLISDSKSEGK